MGVKNLWDILEPCRKKLPLDQLQNKRVCVDLSCWMVQLHNVNKSHCPLKDKLYLKGLFHRLRALIALNCSLIFVTDGSIPALKVSTYRRRLNSVSEDAKGEADLLKATSLKRNMGSEFSCIIKEAKVLGMAFGIPCLDGIEEAEAQCALLNSESLCDGCFSSDSDIFLFGAKTVYREICIGEGGYVVCYDTEDIQKKLGFGRNSLIALAVLLGCDYSRGVHGFGPDAACQFVKSIGDDAILQHLVSEGISFLKKKTWKKQAQLLKSDNKDDALDYNSRANGTMQETQRNEQISEVINAFLKPKCHAADSDNVYRALSVQPFRQIKLQQICAQFFEWSPEKTDEYVLPKIVERDLRRCANLRASSSILGARIPLEEMPVKCPIAGIVKRRKIQGRECFEVEWESSADHKTSIVPAELIESACPEKIMEFEQKRDEKMKKNCRKPKSKKNPLKDKDALAELDQQLQSLLLDNEPVSRTDLAKNDRGNDLGFGLAEHHSLHLHPGGVGKEVIDLLSPSPQPKNYVISKLQGRKEQVEVFDLSDWERSPECSGKTRELEVIDLSDSEFERSPEHARKTEELRSFLAKMREHVS